MHDPSKRRRFLQWAAGGFALAGMGGLGAIDRAAIASDAPATLRQAPDPLGSRGTTESTEMLLDKQTWQALMSGYTVHDCAIMDATRTFYVMVENVDTPHRDPLPRTRLLFVRAARPLDQGRFVLNELGSFGLTEVAFGPALSEFVAVDTLRQVFSYDRQRAAIESDIPGDLSPATLSATTTRIVRVGQDLYAIGWPRRVFRRMGPDAWHLLDAGMSPPAQLHSRDEGERIAAQLGHALRDLAGFSASELYAVGDGGEVWCHDGTRWTRCAFPSNQRLCTVACGADGKVHVSTESGSIWAGRGDAWERIVDAGRGSPYRDSAWFAGRLWCGSDDGLRVLDRDTLVRAELPPEIARVSGRIDLSPDGSHLLTAGAHGAAMFDGSRWSLLFSAFEAP